MNLFKKVPLVILILLFECTVNSDGSILLALLIKIIALKGALFIGTPIALGSFIVGQGLGFFAGNIAGGYTVLKAAQKYHEREKAKWASPTKGHGSYGGGYGGWHGWQSPKYTSGYAKGYGVGNGIAHLLNHVQSKPSYTDYYDHGGYGGYGSPAYGAPSYSVPSYGQLDDGYGGWMTPSYGPPGYPPPKEPSFLDRLTSKLPSFLGGKRPTSAPSASYAEHYNAYEPLPDHVAYNALYPFKGSQPPDHTFAPPGGSPGNMIPHAYLPPTFPGSGSTYAHQPQADSYSFNSYKPHGGSDGEKLFEDNEYTYSSSPYAKPQPKRPHGETGTLGSEMYPGDASSYDGPAKEYTGVMTDIYQTIQNMKTRPYGKPLGIPMGPEVLTPDSYHLSSSEKDEQMLNLASSLHAYAQKRKDTQSKAKPPNYTIEKFLEKKLEEKAAKAKDEEQRQEVKKLITTIRKAYLHQLEESLKSDDSQEDQEEEPEEKEDVENTPNPTTTQKPTEKAAKFVPFLNLAGSRFKREHLESRAAATEETTEANNPLLNLNSEQLEQVKMLYTFMEEIKQFFILVSALDEDTCLQKMVCDVHAQKASGQPTGQMNTYVSNMISTFGIMDAIVPFDPSGPEDSTTKYRLAAKIGSVGGSTDVCKRYYSICTFTSDQIIQLGNQVATATAQPLSENVEESTTISPQFGDRLERKVDVEEVTMPKV